MNIKIKLAVRDWDYFTPLALGDIKSDKFELELHRVDELPNNLENDPRYDAAEISLSRYTIACDKGLRPVIGFPHFLMRGFRQHCVITHKESELTDFSQLKGKRIGLTGWQDTGNVWTRSLLRRDGVDIDDIQWIVGRLTQNDPLTDRLDSFAKAGRINPITDNQSLLDLLATGELDAVFTAFMPQGFFDPDSLFRQLIPYCRQAEYDYFKEVSYIPGLHILGIKPEIIQQYPWLPKELGGLLEQSVELWRQKRIKYADTTPWIIDEIRQVSRDLSTNWNDNGYQANEKMLVDFCYEMYTQGLTENLLTPLDLFPEQLANNS